MRHHGRWSIALAVAVAALVAVPAALASDDLAPVQRGVSASADWGSCIADVPRVGVATCSRTSLFAFGGERATRVCLRIHTAVVRDRSGDVLAERQESGCASADAGALRVAGDLGAAALEPSVVRVFRYECGDDGCDPVGRRDVTVGARFEATGPVARVSDAVRFRNGLCVESYATRLEARESAARGVLNGVSLGPARSASVGKGALAAERVCRDGA